MRPEIEQRFASFDPVDGSPTGLPRQVGGGLAPTRPFSSSASRASTLCTTLAS
jgi:hypothetical protein